MTELFGVNEEFFGFTFLLGSTSGCTLYLSFLSLHLDHMYPKYVECWLTHFYTSVFFALWLCCRGLHVLYLEANSMKVEILGREHQKHLPPLVLLFPVAVQVALTDSSVSFSFHFGFANDCLLI